LWLACYGTQEAIAEEVGVDDDTVSVFLQQIRKTEELPKSVKSAMLIAQTSKTRRSTLAMLVCGSWRYG
jgi:hypothetical protein